MARTDWILPRAEAACHKVFHPDRQAAEGHRITLEIWIQATGRSRPGYRVVPFRCKRCGGYHVAHKKIRNRREAALSRLLQSHEFNSWEEPGLHEPSPEATLPGEPDGFPASWI
ncbi:hypothetical protein [Aquisphaera insulae]|uniref:hypothetical protein n=1 Tax=Aquisphaera insulae TaxID=2712864 RepID=UPI0013EC6FF5|nr:hypothetical protein [Aquisphaera insulae]